MFGRRPTPDLIEDVFSGSLQAVSNFSIKEKRPPQRAPVASLKAMNGVGVRLIKIQLFQALACFKSMMREDQQALFVHDVCL
jgi:hypothetical protein